MDSRERVHADHSEKHVAAGEFIKSAVYGGFDGLCTTLIIALSCFGSDLNTQSVLALGIASLIGDGLSMAAADYLSTTSDAQYMEEEEQRERKQLERDFETQKQQMVQLYLDMGMAAQTANAIVTKLATRPESFLKIMMIEELQMVSGEENPVINSIVTFASFGIFGFIPIIPSLASHSLGTSSFSTAVIVTTIVISAFFLGVIGLSKSFVGAQKWYESTFETIFVGAVAASAAFGMGEALGF